MAFPSSHDVNQMEFDPKIGRRNLEQPKAFRPIRLMSVILKSMERLVAAHIRSTALVDHSTHKAQHAYRPGRSTSSHLHVIYFTKL